TPQERDLLVQAEKETLAITPLDDTRIKQVLDRFYWERLPAIGIGRALREVKPVGGRRKVAALNKFAEKYRQPLSKWVVVGDSITDFRMLRAVEDAGGLAIAFNANGYALPHATMGLASTMLSDLTDVLTAWQKGGRSAAEKLVREKERLGGSGDRNYFQWLSGRKDIADVVQVHARIRKLVREEAARLG
ncbi:MAG: hypothetical protein Q8O16_00635, partial [Dehalococcoidia bacterium]|nr:hypothetical protein [Dehalococcoidia bacterium]